MAGPSMPRSPLYDGCPSSATWNRVTHFQSSRPWPSSSSNLETWPVDNVEDDEAMSETDDEEWEYEETEDLVMLDVGGKSARLAHMSHDYNITGIESDHPFFKLGNLTFKGRWDQLLGTELLLHLDRDPSLAKDQQTVITPMSSTSRSSSHSQASSPFPTPSSSSPSLPTVPGSITRRIVLEPASNLSEREAALLRPLQTSSTADITDVGVAAAATTASAALKRDIVASGSKAPMAIVSYKNHRWLKGVGWVHKDNVDEAINAQADEGQDSDDGESDVEAADEARRVEGSGKRVGTNGDEVGGDEEVEEEEEEEEEGEEGAPTDGEQVIAAAVKLTRRGKPKRKRQPMTEVQKAKANLKRALLRLEKENPKLRSELEERKKAQIEDEQEVRAGTEEVPKEADGSERDGHPQAEAQMDLSQQ